jgi:hypothetical protein
VNLPLAPGFAFCELGYACITFAGGLDGRPRPRQGPQQSQQGGAPPPANYSPASGVQDDEGVYGLTHATWLASMRLDSDCVDADGLYGASGVEQWAAQLVNDLD